MIRFSSAPVLHMVWDSSDNSFVDGSLNAQQRAAFADLTKGKTAGTSSNAWIYTYPDFNVFGFRDADGVRHVFRPEQMRYNARTRVYQARIRGRLLTVGESIFQLTDAH